MPTARPAPPRNRRRLAATLAAAGLLAALAFLLWPRPAHRIDLRRRPTGSHRPASLPPGLRPGVLLVSSAHLVAHRLHRQGGEWQQSGGMEEYWQAGERQWSRTTWPDGLVSCSYYAGPNAPGSCTMTRSGQLRTDSGEQRLFSIQDWGSAVAEGHEGVAPLGQRQWRGQPVAVYRLVAPAMSDGEMLIYLDPANSRPVRQEYTLETYREVREIDYSPVDPGQLFDPAQMARERGAAQ